jgi:hypothetical protein
LKKPLGITDSLAQGFTEILVKIFLGIKKFTSFLNLPSQISSAGLQYKDLLFCAGANAFRSNVTLHGAIDLGASLFKWRKPFKYFQ